MPRCYTTCINRGLSGRCTRIYHRGATDLGLDLQPDAVLKHADYSDYTLPDSSRDIETIFHDMGGQLLILGAPGSGKTILLLQLAEKLLGRAQHDNKQLMPARFQFIIMGQKSTTITQIGSSAQLRHKVMVCPRKQQKNG